MKEYYKITEVARLYGLCTDTLRYYEEQGLLHPFFYIIAFHVKSNLPF